MRFRVLLRRLRSARGAGDGSPHLPHRRDYSEVASTGRGLHVVGEIVDRWGAYPVRRRQGRLVRDHRRRRRVRRERRADPGPSCPPRSPDRGRAAQRAAAHARRLAGARRGAAARDDADPARRGRCPRSSTTPAASEALNVLFEQIPAPDLGEHPEAIMAPPPSRASPGPADAPRPPHLAPHFEVLDSALVEAVALADLGRAAVAADAAGDPGTCGTGSASRSAARPTAAPAWPWASRPTPTRRSTPSARLGPGRGQQLGPRPARRRRRQLIIAASPSALAPLGYADARRAWWGKRLISIIPLRYHQAHIAGFTLHLVNGRSPLSVNRVTVPVLRADGSEVDLDVELEATRYPAAAGSSPPSSSPETPRRG